MPMPHFPIFHLYSYILIFQYFIIVFQVFPRARVSVEIAMSYAAILTYSMHLNSLAPKIHLQIYIPTTNEQISIANVEIVIEIKKCDKL